MIFRWLWNLLLLIVQVDEKPEGCLYGCGILVGIFLLYLMVVLIASIFEACGS